VVTAAADRTVIRETGSVLGPEPADVTAAAAALAALTTVDDDDPGWSTIALPTQWTAARTVEHIAVALLF